MPSNEVMRHLKHELSRSDPWLLVSNEYEQLRYKMIQDYLEVRGNFRNVLEIGCAGGVFTKLLTEYCENLEVLDLIPEALQICTKRMKGRNRIIYHQGDIAETILKREHYNVIIVTEVLYYLENLIQIRRAIRNIVNMLTEDGFVIFGSVNDKVAYRWECYGAETTINEFERHLKLEKVIECKGKKEDERSKIAILIK